MISEHLPRWLFASLTTHFFTRTQGISTYIDGQLLDEPQEEHFEIRMNGPLITETSRQVYSINVTMNIFCASLINDTNFHRIHEMVGIITQACTIIGVYKYGPNDPDPDDQSLIGCLHLVDRVKIDHFGRLGPERPLMRAAVTAVYTGTIIGTLSPN